MALNYNLKYKKLNFFHKVVLSKEGEIVIDRQGFRLKGKGAQDHGEIVYFSDIKDLVSDKDDQLQFSTYKKDRYILSGFSNLFDSFLKDFFRVRNEYLAEQLFMKVGMLYHEYDGHVEILDRNGNLTPKGFCRFQLYEGSLLVIPESHDCFPVYYNFLKSHEFDEDEYVLKLYLENGDTIHISKLGTSFEDFQEALERLLGKMYEGVMNRLKEFLPDFDAGELLKLASLVREGKTIHPVALKKIHEDLPKKFDHLMFAEHEPMQEKVKWLMKGDLAAALHVGFSLHTKMDTHELQVKPWFICALPEKNIVAVSILGNQPNAPMYFFRLMSEFGSGVRSACEEEKLAEKVLEINQSMLLLKFDLAPIYRNKWELGKSRYRTALRKLDYLRRLRKSYLSKSLSPDMAGFQKDFEAVLKKAPVVFKPVIRAVAQPGVPLHK